MENKNSKNINKILKMREQLLSQNFSETEISNIRPLYIQQISENLWKNLINVLVWQRRVGKSWILKYFSSKTDIKNVFAINFEKDIYIWNLNWEELSELFFDNFLDWVVEWKKIYILLDEIQEVKNRYIFIQKLIDRNVWNNAEILISSSTSSVILPVLSEFFPNSSKIYNVVPFLYDEYKKFYPKWWIFSEYLKKSGLPEMIIIDSNKQTILSENYIMSLKNTIIVEDIVKIFWVKDVFLLKKLYFLLLKNCWKTITNNALTTRLKEENILTNHNTVWQYVEYIVSTNLIHTVEIVDEKWNLTNQRIYFVNDLGLINYCWEEITLTENTKILNYILLLLLRQNIIPYAIISKDWIINLSIKREDWLYMISENWTNIQNKNIKQIKYDLSDDWLDIQI